MNHSSHIAIDEYVLDVLMPDLVRHDHSAPAFLIYLVLWTALFRTGDTPILNLKQPVGSTDAQQRSKIEFLKELNERYSRDKQDDSELDARTRSYELAYQMQSAAPEAVDLSSETETTKKLYGMDEPETAVYGANCLMARRLVERGVRFVEVYSGSGSRWDAHRDLVTSCNSVHSLKTTSTTLAKTSSMSIDPGSSTITPM